MKKNKLVWILCGLMSVSLAASVATLNVEESSADVATPIFSEDFENGLGNFAAFGSGSPMLVTETEELDCAYTGMNGMKQSGIWSRNQTLSGAWIQQGDFFEFNGYAKWVSGENTQAAAALRIWGQDDKQAWTAFSGPVQAIPYTPVKEADGWVHLNNVFGVYSDGEKVYLYHNGGKLEEAAQLAGMTITTQVYLDIGATQSGSLYFDDLSITKSAAKKDVTVTLFGGDGNVSGATLTVCDINGIALATQPEVVEENGVYTLKDVPFEKFNTEYMVKAEKGGVTLGTNKVSFLNAETSISSAFTATVTVKDEQNNFLTGATLSFDGKTVTANDNGVYTLENLLSEVNVTVSYGDLLSKTVKVSPTNKDVTVVLKLEKTALEVDGNLVPAGNLESAFTLKLSSYGVKVAVSNDEQYSGKNSLKLTEETANGNAQVRLSTGLNANATVYYYEIMAKSDTSAALKFGVNFVCNKVGGNYASAMILSEPIALTSEWQMYSILLSARLDESNNKIYTSLNGGEEVEFATAVTGVAAVDLVFYVSGGEAFVDDLTVLETFTGSVWVKDELGNALSEATFVLTDHAGRESSIVPTFDEATGKYTFNNLKGVVKLVATVGEKAYSAVTLSKALNSIEIESSYTIRLTLKDQQGKAVIGANVKVRKGITVIGQFVDNGDGTYTFADAMGTVSIVIIADGYDFERKDNVSASNATLTVVGEKYESPNPGNGGGNEGASSGGCGSVMGASAAVLALSVFAGVALWKKKED